MELEPQAQNWLHLVLLHDIAGADPLTQAHARLMARHDVTEQDALFAIAIIVRPFSTMILADLPPAMYVSAADTVAKCCHCLRVTAASSIEHPLDTCATACLRQENTMASSELSFLGALLCEFDAEPEITYHETKTRFLHIVRDSAFY